MSGDQQSDGRRGGSRSGDGSRSIEEPVERLAVSTVRVGLLILGIVVLLFASGQIVGFDILAYISDALDTREARWFTVAFFGLILIFIAFRGFDGE